MLENQFKAHDLHWTKGNKPPAHICVALGVHLESGRSFCANFRVDYGQFDRSNPYAILFSMNLPDKPESPDSTPLNASQFKAWQRMRKLLEDEPEADRRYNAIPDSKNGRIISTDVARFLDSDYEKQPRKGHLRDIKPGWGLAYLYANDRFERELQKRARRKVVRFMAGGWAAGKTHALEKESSPDLAWDGTLSDSRWAAEKIDLALAQDWKVEVAYVFRDLELAFYGAVERGIKEGRMVPLDKLPTTHRAVQKSIIDLTALYAGEPSVSFILLHNLGTEKISCGPLKICRDDLDSSGGLHYTPSNEQYYLQAAPHIGKASAS